MIWKGTNSDLPTIFLNSHTDVVPVFEEHWSHPPFAAEIDNEGKIYARGAQDMKCIGMQYLSAIKTLKSSGFVPKRTVYVTFVPEEEIGGAGGMKDFVKSQYFEKMNVGVALDESAAYPGDAIMLFYAERPSWQPCIKFLKKIAEDLGLTTQTFHPVSEKFPILVMTWQGTQPELPAILLNSHTDVVPVFEEHWTRPPFGAEMDEEGNIYARGAQDMKCVGMQYLSALKALKASGFVPKRTIHLSYVPEEETGGIGGMKEFVDTEEFRSLKIGFSLDEGIASPDETYPVFYAERAIWHVWFKVNGSPGHGSLLLENTAGEKARKLIDRMDDYRKTQVEKLKANSHLVTADVTTVNLTILQGGVQSNVIPPQFTVVFDIRLAIDVNHAQFEAMLNEWCEEAGGNIDIEFEQKEDFVEPTSLDNSNVYWNAFKSAIDELGLTIKTQVFPGGTDSRFIRAKSVPAIGFSPMNHTPVLLHDHNEFIKAETYLRGIEIYKKIIPKLASA